MLVPTFLIQHDHEETLTAALLCSYSVPAIDHNFLVYSLNEVIDDYSTRVYLVSLQIDDDGYSLLSPITTDTQWETATEIFELILQEALTGDIRTENTSFHLIDSSEQVVSTSLLKEHRTLDITTTQITKLFSYQPSAPFGPALQIERVPVQNPDNEDFTMVQEHAHKTSDHDSAAVQTSSDYTDDTALAPELAPLTPSPQQLVGEPADKNNSDTSTHALSSVENMTSTIPELTFDNASTQSLDDEEIVLRELDQLSGLAEEMTAQRKHSQLRQEAIDSKELQLKDLEQLYEKKNDLLLNNLKSLAHRQAAQNRKQSELATREDVLRRMAEALAIKQKKLEDAKNKLNSILATLQPSPHNA